MVTFSVSSASGSAPSLAGFEVVLLALYCSEVKVRSGKPLLISIQQRGEAHIYESWCLEQQGQRLRGREARSLSGFRGQPRLRGKPQRRCHLFADCNWGK